MLLVIDCCGRTDRARCHLLNASSLTDRHVDMVSKPIHLFVQLPLLSTPKRNSQQQHRWTSLATNATCWNPTLR